MIRLMLKMIHRRKKEDYIIIMLMTCWGSICLAPSTKVPILSRRFWSISLFRFKRRYSMIPEGIKKQSTKNTMQSTLLICTILNLLSGWLSPLLISCRFSIENSIVCKYDEIKRRMKPFQKKKFLIFPNLFLHRFLSKYAKGNIIVKKIIMAYRKMSL